MPCVAYLVVVRSASPRAEVCSELGSLVALVVSFVRAIHTTIRAYIHVAVLAFDLFAAAAAAVATVTVARLNDPHDGFLGMLSGSVRHYVAV